MKVYLNGTVIEFETNTNIARGVYQKGTLNLVPVNSAGVLVGLQVFFGATTQLINIPLYDNGDPLNSIADSAGVVYPTVQSAWDALCAIVGFNTGGGGGAVTSVNGNVGVVTVDFDSVLVQGNDSAIRALFNGAPYIIQSDLQTIEANRYQEVENPITASIATATVDITNGQKVLLNITHAGAVTLTLAGISGKSGVFSILVTGNAQNLIFPAGTQQNNGSNVYPVNITVTRSSTEDQVVVVNYYASSKILIN